MPQIDNLRKSLVDVALGALAFLCSVDRSAVPITRTLSVLGLCITAWLTLTIASLSSPALIGGESPTIRFSELAPVIVLSSPMLWAALRHVQVLLETIDTLLGALTLARNLLKQLRGVFDHPQSFRRTRCLHVVLHSVSRDDSPYPLSSRLTRRVHFACTCPEKRCHFEPSLRPDSHPSISAQFMESLVFKWSSELLPLGTSEGLILPRHLCSDAFVKEVFAYDKHGRHLDCTDPGAVVTRSPGLVAKIPYSFRRLSYLLRCLSLRVAPHAVLCDTHVAVDNVHSGRLLNSGKFGIRILLSMRRAALKWPAIGTKYVQGMVSAIISSVDAFVGEIGGFALVTVLECAHPLKIRRENAMYILCEKGAVVADILRRRELLKEIGHDRYMMCCADAILVRTFMTILKDREDLAAKAIIMLRVGNTWRRKPQQAQIKAVSDRRLLLGNFGNSSLPTVSPGDLNAMILCDTVESFDSEAIELALVGEEGMVILSQSVCNTARQRGYVPGAIRSGIGGRLFAGLCVPENDKVRETKDAIVQDFCNDGWLVSFSYSNLYNKFKVDGTTTVGECISEMVNICMDCHAIAICSFLSGMEWAEVKAYAKERHYMNIHLLREDIVKVEQHDFLVACHRNEVMAVAWMFVDEVMGGKWLGWQRWCVSDAFSLCDAVFR